MSLWRLLGLHYFPVREVLAGETLFYAYDRDIIVSLIDNYLSPNNLRVFVLNKQLGDTATNVERHYKVRYRTEPLDRRLLEIWGDSFTLRTQALPVVLKQHGLSLPGPNPFISQSLKLEDRGVVELPIHPTRLVYGQGHACYAEGTGDSTSVSVAGRKCNVFHKQDATFDVPKTAVTLNFYFKPQQEDTVKAYIMTALYVRLACFSITEVSCPPSPGAEAVALLLCLCCFCCRPPDVSWWVLLSPSGFSVSPSRRLFCVSCLLRHSTAPR